MAQVITGNRWGSAEDQAIMYKNHGKKVAIVKLTDGEKLVYPMLKVGMIVEIDHQYSTDCTDIYVSKNGEILGRVSIENVVFVKKTILPKCADYLSSVKSKSFLIMFNARSGIGYLVDTSMNHVLRTSKKPHEFYEAF